MWCMQRDISLRQCICEWAGHDPIKYYSKARFMGWEIIENIVRAKISTREFLFVRIATALIKTSPLVPVTFPVQQFLIPSSLHLPELLSRTEASLSLMVLYSEVAAHTWCHLTTHCSFGNTEGNYWDWTSKGGRGSRNVHCWRKNIEKWFIPLRCRLQEQKRDRQSSREKENERDLCKKAVSCCSAVQTNNREMQWPQFTEPA